MGFKQGHTVSFGGFLPEDWKVRADERKAQAEADQAAFAAQNNTAVAGIAVGGVGLMLLTSLVGAAVTVYVGYKILTS